MAARPGTSLVRQLAEKFYYDFSLHKMYFPNMPYNKYVVMCVRRRRRGGFVCWKLPVSRRSAGWRKAFWQGPLFKQPRRARAAALPGGFVRHLSRTPRSPLTAPSAPPPPPAPAPGATT